MKRLDIKRGALTALNSTVPINVGTAECIMLQVLCTSAAGLTVVLEGSLDSTDGYGGTWFSLAMAPTNATNLYTQVVSTGVLAAQPTLAWFARTTPLRWCRARASAWTSGVNVVAVLQPAQGSL